MHLYFMSAFAALAWVSCFAFGGAVDPLVGKPLPPWQDGELDIHHIDTGSGNSAFFIFPDGTTMLFDAGDVDRIAMRAYAPLKLQNPVPDDSRRAGQWIADYIRQFMPAGESPRLDYAVISHFHSDHFGKLQKDSPLSHGGAYRLTGITDVAELIPIGMLIDRAAPKYDIPTDMRACFGGKGTLANYIAFADDRLAHHQRVERLRVGHSDQIVLTRKPGAYPGFVVRNLAANGELWTGIRDETVKTIPWGDAGGCKVGENPFSIALKISYGKFDYYTGGDITGMVKDNEPAWTDVETKLGPVVGPVDAMTLDHHGNRDASNANFLRALRPRVIVEQNWVSDQPGGEVVHRMASQSLYSGPRDVFSIGTANETRIAIGVWMDRLYDSYSGHVVIRVAPGGESYDVYILDETSRARFVKGHFGPFLSQ